MRFDSHFSLSELPWFDVRDDRLVISDPEIGPIADVHAHLALTYGPGGRINVWKEHPRAKAYLPMEAGLDLDVYMNRNFNRRDLRRMKFDMAGSVTPFGMRTTHTAANLEAEMADLGICGTVLLPIDLARVGTNAKTYLAAANRSRGGIVSLGSVHPKARGRFKKLEAQKRAGARGVKMHPAVQLIAPDDPAAMELYDMCGQLDLPILWHCGPVGIEARKGRELCQLARYAPPVREFPGTTFVLGHSGALQFDQALELANKHDNVWMETASQSLTNIKRMVKEAPPERIMSGSDWPFYHLATAVAKALLATEGHPEARRRLLWDNAARLFGLTAEA